MTMQNVLSQILLQLHVSNFTSGNQEAIDDQDSLDGKFFVSPSKVTKENIQLEAGGNCN